MSLFLLTIIHVIVMLYREPAASVVHGRTPLFAQCVVDLSSAPLRLPGDAEPFPRACWLSLIAARPRPTGRASRQCS
jgi:hypothetical protein